MAKTSNVQIVASATEKQKIKKLCEVKAVNMSALIREAVKRAVERAGESVL